jgi:hypothetical protein
MVRAEPGSAGKGAARLRRARACRELAFDPDMASDFTVLPGVEPRPLARGGNFHDLRHHAPDGPIPSRYTCEGCDVSPPLAWHGVPPGTKSLALIVDDPDAPDSVG